VGDLTLVFIEHYFGKDGIKDKIGFEDVHKFIEEANPEGIALEYKEPSKNLGEDTDNLAETISSFLNTNGGLLIYGISVKRERRKAGGKSVVDKQYPDKIVPCDPSLTKERLQQLLYPKIEPWNLGTRIVEIKGEGQEHIFFADVPQSRDAPHMAKSKFNFRTESGSQSMTYRQISTAFIANRAEKSELVKNVYGPIYTEIGDQLKAEKYYVLTREKFDLVYRDFRHLWILVDSSLRVETEQFYDDISAFNLEAQRFYHNVQDIVANEAIDYLKEVGASELYHELNKLSESAKRGIYILISAIGTKEGHSSSEDLWACIAYQTKLEERFVRNFGDENISGKKIMMDRGARMTTLNDNQSRQLYERCVKVVEESPITKRFRSRYAELMHRGRELLERYEELLR